MTDDLKPCPFCGGEADIYYSNGEGIWKIMCKKCFLRVEDGFKPRVVTKETLIAWWNERVGDGA